MLKVDDVLADMSSLGTEEVSKLIGVTSVALMDYIMFGDSEETYLKVKDYIENRRTKVCMKS